MTEDHTTRTRRRASLRKLLYVPVAVGVLAGAISVGTGIGSTAPTAAPDAVTAPSSSPDTAPASTGDPHWWSLYNYTGQAIYGTWSEQVGTKVSELDLVPSMPLMDLGHESRPRLATTNEDWAGRICFNHAWWNLPRGKRDPYGDASFMLRLVDGDLHVSWPTAGRLVDESLILSPHDGPC